MYRILSASKDTYITNKVINNSFRATDANVGQAGTLDLFKLFNESTFTSASVSVTSSVNELSRILVKFDLDPIRKLTGSSLDISNSSFKCFLRLHDVYGGQTTPSNFKTIVFPLSKSFDEGIGRDVISFDDLDAANWVTSSVSGDSVTEWFVTGATRQGLLGTDDIDVISSGTLSGETGVQLLWSEQLFSKGTEDLNIDITTIVSATLKGLIPDFGFRISFSGSQETDRKSRFVKRFASRHVKDVHKRPKLIVQYNDTIQDHTNVFQFNVSGSLFLNNFERGKHANIVSGTFPTRVSGSNSLLLLLTSGSVASGTYFSKEITGSQHKIGNNFITGVYSASFAISQWATGALTNQIALAHSATFTQIWSSLDKTVGFLTSTLVVNSEERTSFNNTPSRLFANITNMRDTYRPIEKVRFRVFVEDFGTEIKAQKLPLENKSSIFTQMYYRIRDYDSNHIVVPFERKNSATLLSCDSEGMYFDFFMDSLPVGRTYVIDFLIKDKGIDQIFSDVPAKFRVDP